MRILLTGIDHKTTPLEVRERVAFSREGLPEALKTLAAQVGEGVILSTCNRTEVYVLAERPAKSFAQVSRFLSEYHEVEPGILSPYLVRRTDLKAVLHLFRVSSGLESMMLGEAQILGQVRGAMAAASHVQLLPAPLSRLFHRSIRTGRRVREETDLGIGSPNPGLAAVRLCENALGTLGSLRVILVGAGEAGQMVARAIAASGPSDLAIANRTRQRAQQLATELGGRPMTLEGVRASLADADIVISATEAPEPVLSTEHVAAAAEVRKGRPIFLLDLGVPRNISPDAASVEGVSLFHIDDLGAQADEDSPSREEAASRAQLIVEEEVARFASWWDSLEALPVITALRSHADEIRAGELRRALQKMGDVSPEDVETLDAMTRSIVNRLLHDPTVALKRGNGRAPLRTVRELFGLQR